MQSNPAHPQVAEVIVLPVPSKLARWWVLDLHACPALDLASVLTSGAGISFWNSFYLIIIEN
jgi:hypothetical protein